MSRRIRDTLDELGPEDRRNIKRIIVEFNNSEPDEDATDDEEELDEEELDEEELDEEDASEEEDEDDE